MAFIDLFKNTQNGEVEEELLEKIMKHLTTLLLALLVLGGCVANYIYTPVNGSPMIVEDGYGKQIYSLKGETEFTRYLVGENCKPSNPLWGIDGCGEITTNNWTPLTYYNGTKGIVSYEGEFLNNNWYGQGIVTYDNGDWLEAEWEFYDKRKEGTGGICYRADTGTFHDLIPYKRSHIIFDHGSAVCESDGLMGFGRFEGCYKTQYEETLRRMCKGDEFTLNDLFKTTFKVAAGAVLVAGIVATSPAGQAALANEQAKNQRKQEAAAYKKGKRDGIRKAAKRKAAMCQLNRNC